MTTILAVRSLGMLLCDTQGTYGTMHHQARKAFCNGAGLYAAAGDAHDCELFLAWVTDGEIREEKPTLHESFTAVALLTSYAIRHCSDKLAWEDIFENVWAIGSGREFAIGALCADVSPHDAMLIAAQCDVFTGEPIQCFTLEKVGDYPKGVWLS